VDINRERIDHWVGKGAQLSDTVRTLLKRHVTPTAPAEAASASARGASADKAAGKGASA
jgi:ribosomal protein S16